MIKKSVRKILILLAASALLSACGINTGLDPIDDVLSPRKTYTQDFRFINESSESLNFSGGLSQEIDAAHCESYGDRSQKEVAPGHTDSMHLSLKCRTGQVVSSLAVTKHGSFSTGQINLRNQSDVNKLPVGTQFKVISNDKTQSVDIVVVSNNSGPDSANMTYWPNPSNLAAGEAWISGQTLNVAIPLSFTKAVDIAFPKALGLNKFGYYDVRDEGGYFVSNMNYDEGITIYPRIVGDTTEVTCNSVGCTSRAF